MTQDGVALFSCGKVPELGGSRHGTLSCVTTGKSVSLGFEFPNLTSFLHQNPTNLSLQARHSLTAGRSLQSSLCLETDNWHLKCVRVRGKRHGSVRLPWPSFDFPWFVSGQERGTDYKPLELKPEWLIVKPLCLF